MNKEEEIKRAYIWMAYGDAIGFLYENTGSFGSFQNFSVDWDINNKLSLSAGQYSDLTQLMLLTTKSLLDAADKSQVSVDYSRFQEELNFYSFYRTGNPLHILKALEDREGFLRETYINDIRGYGISRVAAIILANKNFNKGIDEVCKNILFFNQHPNVILTGIIISRIFYLLLENKGNTREELLKQLKDFIIGLDIKDALREVNQSKYSVNFERERVNYIIDLDRLIKGDKVYNANNSWSCKHMLLAGLINYWRILKGEGLWVEGLPQKDSKESLALAYGFAALSKEAVAQQISTLMNLSFIEGMGEYTAKLRNYKVNKKPYINGGNKVDLFKLEASTVFKHDVFNVSRILERKKKAGYIHVLLENKTGNYLLIKKDSS